ncbi:hypothetical protein Plhal710r2_c032g0118351 [Plasmopara halstedii]
MKPLKSIFKTKRFGSIAYVNSNRGITLTSRCKENTARNHEFQIMSRHHAEHVKDYRVFDQENAKLKVIRPSK